MKKFYNNKVDPDSILKSFLLTAVETLESQRHTLDPDSQSAYRTVIRYLSNTISDYSSNTEKPSSLRRFSLYQSCGEKSVEPPPLHNLNPLKMC